MLHSYRGIHFQDFIFLDKGGFIMMNHQNMDTISNTTSSSNEDNSTKDTHTENVVQLVISLYVPLFYRLDATNSNSYCE